MGIGDAIEAFGANLKAVLIILSLFAISGLFLQISQHPNDPKNIENAGNLAADEATGGLFLFSDIVNFLGGNQWLLLAFIAIVAFWIRKGVNPFWE